MVFTGIKEDGGWVTVEYSATWKYGYDFMLDAAQVIVSDFKSDLQRFAKGEMAGSKLVDIIGEVQKCGGILRDCAALTDECGAFAVAGISGIMECPLQIMLFNQTRVVRLDCPIKQLFDEHGEHVFDHYMNSVEIKAYCADTERRTVERLKNAET